MKKSFYPFCLFLLLLILLSCSNDELEILSVTPTVRENILTLDVVVNRKDKSEIEFTIKDPSFRFTWEVKGKKENSGYIIDEVCFPDNQKLPEGQWSLIINTPDGRYDEKIFEIR